MQYIVVHPPLTANTERKSATSYSIALFLSVFAPPAVGGGGCANAVSKSR